MTRTRAAGLLALLVAALVTAVTIRFNTFAPWGTDAAAYVESAHRWVAGRLLEPSPVALWAPWTVEATITTPLGFRPGLPTGTDVTEYPPGLPLLMAAALWLAGEAGPFVVAPIGAGLLVLCAYGLARQLAGPWWGLLAAVLVAISPATVGMAVQPMSDVPVTALWTLAWLMSLRPGMGASAAAGAAAAGAILIRPNTAPLAAVVIVLVLLSRPGGIRAGAAWRAATVAGLMLALGPGLVMWAQTVLYGGPFTSSYRGGWDWMFALAHVPKNLVLIPRFLTMLHSPLLFAGVATPLLMARQARGDDAVPQARLVAWSALSLALVNVLIYLPYWPYEDPAFVRFQLLPITALFVLLAGLSRHLWRFICRHFTVGLAGLALVPVVIVGAYPGALLRYPLTIRDGQQRVPLMGRYLREVLPDNAVIITHLQGGAMAHYTNAPIIRLDLIAASALDPIVADLITHGYAPVLLLGDGDEGATLAARFPDSRYRRLEWPPRARAFDVTGLSYYRVADQVLHARSQRWPVDVLRPVE